MEDQDLTHVKKSLEQAKASLAVEGMFLTEEEEALVLDRLQGKITQSEFLSQALKLAKKS